MSEERREWMNLVAELRAENERLRAENERVRERVQYWSYCMSEGMRKECPERVNELADFLVSLKIAPYYVRHEVV